MHTKLKYMFELMELDNSVIAVPVGENANQFHGVIKLNKTGAEILGMLKEDVSEAEIVKALSTRYVEPFEKLQADVHQFISIFQERDLLV